MLENMADISFDHHGKEINLSYNDTVKYWKNILKKQLMIKKILYAGLKLQSMLQNQNLLRN